MPQEHTPGPWKLVLRGGQGPVIEARLAYPHDIATVDMRTLPEDVANAERIVACVNACEGLDPEAVPELVAALEAAYGALYLLGAEGRLSPAETAVLAQVADALAKVKGAPGRGEEEGANNGK